MKNFQKFADKQLSKQEMNHVKGGYDCWTCTVTMSSGGSSSGRACGETIDEVAADIVKYYENIEMVRVNCY